MPTPEPAPTYPVYFEFIHDLLNADESPDGAIRIVRHNLAITLHADRDKLRIVCYTNHDQPDDWAPDACRDLAYDILTTIFSEATNDDACDVTIRERSGHFFAHDDISLPDDFTCVVVDAAILDSLS